MTMTPEQVAAGLSEAQNRAMLCAEQDGHLGNYFLRWWHGTTETMVSLRRKGLGTAVWSGLVLTPLGLQVRAILEQQAALRARGQ